MSLCVTQDGAGNGTVHPKIGLDPNMEPGLAVRDGIAILAD
jgi:hypothetical protein